MSSFSNRKTDSLSEIINIDADKDWNSKKIRNILANADKLYVSDRKGSDTWNDGSRNAPYKTLQKAIDVADADISLEAVVIELDTETANSYSGSVPDSFTGKNGTPLSIITPQAYLMSGLSIISTLEIGQQNLVSLDNLTVDTIKEPATGANATAIYIEECFILNIENDDGDPFDDFTLILEGTILSDTGNALSNCITQKTRVSGEALSNGLSPNKLFKFNALDLNGYAIENLADPTNAQDAVTKAYGDANYLGGGGSAQWKDNVTLAGATPVIGDFSAWSNGDNGVGVGTGGRIFLVHKVDGSTIKWVELS